MKFWRYLSLITLALLLVLLDVSFFSNFQIHDAFLLSSFVVLIIFSIIDKSQSYLFFACALIFFLVALSSLEPALLIINFLFLPMTLNWLRSRFFPQPTVYTSILYIFASTIIFNVVALSTSGDFGLASIIDMGYFVALNTACGFIVFIFYRRIAKHLVREEIKI